MTVEEPREEIAIELQALDATVGELSALLRDISDREPTLREVAADLAPFRRFRHVVHKGYGIELRWSGLRPGIERAPRVLRHFREKLDAHLDALRGGD